MMSLTATVRKDSFVMEHLRAFTPESNPQSPADPIPASFDPVANPIIAEHFFGVPPDIRRQRQAEHLHRLGARPVLEALVEVADGRDLGLVLDAFARLDPDIVNAVGGADFPAPPIHEVGR